MEQTLIDRFVEASTDAESSCVPSQNVATKHGTVDLVFRTYFDGKLGDLVAVSWRRFEHRLELGDLRSFLEMADALGATKALILARSASVEAWDLRVQHDEKVKIVSNIVTFPEPTVPVAYAVPRVNVQEFLPGEEVSQEQWDRIHEATNPPAQLVLSTETGTSLRWGALVAALPTEEQSAWTGVCREKEGRRPTSYEYRFPQGKLTLEDLSIRIEGVRFKYWIEIRALEAATLEEGWAEHLLQWMYG